MAGIRYVADKPGQLLTVQFDGLTALYHRPSGTTHLLAPPAPQILEVLASGPATVPTVLARLGRQFDLDSGPGARAAIESRLAELEAAGLVSRL